MSDKETRDGRVFRLSRRKALKGLAAGIGALALPAKDSPASVLSGLKPSRLTLR